MRNVLNRRFQMAVSTAVRSAIGMQKPNNGGLWTNMRTISNMTGLVRSSGDEKLNYPSASGALVNGGLLGNTGVIRSSSQFIRIWEQQKSNYSMKHQEKELEGATNSSMKQQEGEGEIEGLGSHSMKHQEIEGPTVERDMSEVAKETREVTESMMKSMYNLSKVVAVLGISQLAVGAYILSSSGSGLGSLNVLNMSMSAVAFAFPFSMALMMRQSLKAMHFFNKMEQIGRLQLLTSSMQISKNLRLFFLRLRVITLTSLSGLLLSFLYSLFSTFPSAS